jgi:hypothetical protein
VPLVSIMIIILAGLSSTHSLQAQAIIRRNLRIQAVAMAADRLGSHGSHEQIISVDCNDVGRVSRNTDVFS